MTAASEITATSRELIGKSSKRLAHENLIPAVVYGPGREPKSVSIDRHDFELWLAHHSAGSAVVQLVVDGEKKPLNVMLREVHHSPVKGNVLHVDFLVVNMDKETHATVPLHLINDPEGVKAGGVLTVNIHEINVMAKPNDIPTDGIEVDVAALEIGDSIHLSDVVVPAGVTVSDDLESIVASVQAPRAEIEEVGEEAVAEPELIGTKEESE